MKGWSGDRAFDVRRDRKGFSVYDVWTGGSDHRDDPSGALSREDADDTAELLNRRAQQGNRQLMRWRGVRAGAGAIASRKPD